MWAPCWPLPSWCQREITCKYASLPESHLETMICQQVYIIVILHPKMKIDIRLLPDSPMYDYLAAPGEAK